VVSIGDRNSGLVEMTGREASGERGHQSVWEAPEPSGPA